MTVLLILALAFLQSTEKLLIASIDPGAVEQGSVAELVWEGSELVVLIAVPRGAGHEPRFYALPGPGVALRRLPAPPAGRDEYWRKKAARLSPTGLGRIDKSSDSKMPMMGIGSLEQRLGNAADFGSMDQTFEVRLGARVIHSRRQHDIYDGEVWAWSPPEQNQIAYVDSQGDLWIADADGARPRQLAKGNFLLPAWSLDGRAIAVVERNTSKKRWDVYVVTVPGRR